jgi:hypothetical protein
MKKTFACCAAALIAIFASAGAASAASPIITFSPSGLNAPLGQQMVVDFDDANAPGFNFAQNAGAFTRLGSLGLWSGVSAPPADDLSMYETITGAGSAVLTSSKLMSSLSLYIGSPDSYNAIEFLGPQGYDVKLTGANLFSPPTDFGGNQGVGLRVNYNFGGHLVNQVIFSSSGNSFEFDNIAASVPEPASWALMIIGVAGLGAQLRSQRRLARVLA